MKPSRLVAGASVVCTAFWIAVPLAHAAFLDGAQTRSAFTASTLAPASNLAVTRRCTLSLLGVVVGAELDATWSASTSAWVGGYRAELLNNSGVVLQTQSTSSSVRKVTFTLSDLLTATYHVRVTATYASWTSTAISATNTSC